MDVNEELHVYNGNLKHALWVDYDYHPKREERSGWFEEDNETY